MRAPAWARASFRVLAVCALAGLASAGVAEPIRPFRPDPTVAGAAPLSEQTWTLETPLCTARLRQLDDRERLAILERITGQAIDPFATPPGAAGFLTFALELDNRSSGTVLFHPQRCRLVAQRQIAAPIGLEHLETTLGMLGHDLPEAYRKAGRVLLEGGRQLAPGESLTGLLVYQGLRARTRSFVVEVQLTLPDGQVASLKAPYRREARR